MTFPWQRAVEKPNMPKQNTNILFSLVTKEGQALRVSRDQYGFTIEEAYVSEKHGDTRWRNAPRPHYGSVQHLAGRLQEYTLEAPDDQSLSGLVNASLLGRQVLSDQLRHIMDLLEEGTHQQPEES